MSVPSDPRIYPRPAVFNQALEFYWQPPSSDGGSNISSYILECSNIGFISVLPSSSRKARVDNLPNQTNYLFTLKATNDFGNSNIVSFRSVQPGFPPDLPSNLNVTVDLANSEPLLNLSLTQPDTTNSSNITYNALTMYPLDNTGNIIENSPFMFKRFSLPGLFEPVTLIDTNTDYEYRGLIQSINDVRWSKNITYYNFRINPNLPTNNLKLWLDPYDSSVLTLSNNKVIQWNDKSINQSNATISETFAPTYDSGNALLNFSGTQYMNLPANTLPSANTAYSMFIYASASNINMANLWLLYSGSPSSNLSLGAKFNNGNIIQSWFGTDLTGNTANFIATIDLPLLSTFTYDGNIRRTYVNGTLINSEVARNRNSDTSNNIIGSISTLNANLIGSIGSIILYDRLLTDRERTSLETYLINKRSNLSLKNYGNLTLWLDAMDNNTLYNSNINEKITYHNPVSVWLDKSNNNNHAFQSNTAIAPLKKVSSNRDYLNFNSGYMISNIATLPFDAFLIVQLNNLSNINDVIGISPVGNNYNSLSYNITANRWSNDSTSNIFVSSNSETSTGFVMMEYSLANNNAFIRRNGSNIANITNFNWSLPNNSRLYIGNDNGITFNNSLKGNIGEIIMFNKQLTDNQRFPVEGYLAWKWGIQNRLPSSHLFYNKPPSLFSFASGSIINGTITGGIKSYFENYTIHTFSTVGNSTCVVSDSPVIVDILIVAGGGGGGGGGAGAGGGAGGVVYRTNFTLNPGTYNVSIGNGGIGGVDANTRGSNGGNSVFHTLIAIGGGGGGADASTQGLSGGSGGAGAGQSGIGGAGGSGLQPSSASGGYGNNGADGHDVGPNYGGGGGGGAGSVGTMGNGTTGGNGGTGLSFTITGTSVNYGGGGGGGTFNGGTPGNGGIGGGGAGGGGGANGMNATNNTGGGGGGAGNGIGGNGGSGIVIIRYLTTSSILFSPSDISGLQLWLDANDVNANNTIFANNSPVTTWYDKSGYNNHATGGISPIYTSWNKAVYFDSTKFLTLPNGTLPFNDSSYSYFLVFSMLGNNGIGGILGGGSQVNNQAFNIRGDGTNGIWQYWWFNDIGTNNKYISYGKSIYETWYTSGSTRNILLNYSGAKSDTPGTRSQTNNNNFIGKTIFNEFGNVFVHEILVYNNQVTQTQREKLEGYLGWKWGIQSNLSISHPYYTFSPSLNIPTVLPFPNDNYLSTSNIAYCYSVRDIIPSYTGPVFRIRRSSDNAKQDFYSDSYQTYLTTNFNNSGISYSNWIGSNIGYVTTWYDQSGKNNHATNLVDNNTQPNLKYQNGKWVVECNKANSTLLNITTPSLVKTVFSQFLNYNDDYGGFITTNTDNSFRFGGRHIGLDGGLRINGDRNSADWFVAGTGTKIAYNNGTNATDTLLLSGTASWNTLSVSIQTPNSNYSFTKIGTNYYTDRGINGYMTELICHSTEMSDSNMMAFYNNRLIL